VTAATAGPWERLVKRRCLRAIPLAPVHLSITTRWSMAKMATVTRGELGTRSSGISIAQLRALNRTASALCRVEAQPLA